MNSLKEEWRNIEGYPNYQVSSFGRVKRLNFRRIGNNKILKQFYNAGGYCLIKLYLNKIPRTFKIHRLVAIAFKTNPKNKRTVNHIDEIKKHNFVDNLEWATDKENTRHSLAKPFNKLTLDGIFIKKYESLSEAVCEGFQMACISMCCNNKLKKHAGFKWKYV